MAVECSWETTTTRVHRQESRATEADDVLAEALTEAQDSENRCRELSRVVTSQKLETEDLHNRLSQLEHANAALLEELQRAEQEVGSEPGCVFRLQCCFW